jgi:hypothetical protein
VPGTTCEQKRRRRDHRDECGAAERAHDEGLDGVGRDGDHPPPRRVGGRWDESECRLRARRDLEECVRIEGRQKLERVRSQLWAHEHELGRQFVGNRDAHASAFGIRGVRP